jgi:signal transduction histidine kinase/ActR/RegA family two-component response regulator
LLVLVALALLDATYLGLGAVHSVPWIAYVGLAASYGASRTRVVPLAPYVAAAGLLLAALGSFGLFEDALDPTSALGLLILLPPFAATYGGARAALAAGATGVLGGLSVLVWLGTGIAPAHVAGAVVSVAVATGATLLASSHQRWRELQGQRTLHEREEQLRQSQKMEAIGRLAGGIAHDFNNLLTVIAGGVELLRRSENRPELSMIETAADSAMSVTRQLLLLSRPGVVEFRPVDLNALLRNSTQMVARIIGEGIEVVVEPGPRLWPVSADEAQVQQVLLNLATNARDAMPGGGVLRVVTENVIWREEDGPQVPPGEYVVVAVSDSGVGMDAQTRERIFEPFFSTKARGKGTGLGLAIVFGIVAGSGGHVAVESKPGHGTTFRLFFPRATDLPEGRRSSGSFLAARRVDGSETILLVEDDDAVRALCARALGDAGYRVLEANCPGSVWARWKRQRFVVDLLVTDVVLPGWSGPELAARLREARPGLPVLYMSGYAPHTVEAVDAIPPEDLLSKPFKPKQLLHAVRRKLDDPEGQRVPA